MIIYLNKKERVLELAEKLIENKFMVSCLYGDLENHEKAVILK
jgi:superfamily II DNA/RNA helicase